jgi:hypothetical protein
MFTTERAVAVPERVEEDRCVFSCSFCDLGRLRENMKKCGHNLIAFFVTFNTVVDYRQLIRTLINIAVVQTTPAPCSKGKGKVKSIQDQEEILRMIEGPGGHADNT